MKTILIADDDPVMIKLLEHNFKKIGLNTIPCSDGDDASEKAIARKPDLAILDLNLPKKLDSNLLIILEIISHFHRPP